jgi:hypothetical protein
MITLKEWMELVDYRITGGSEFQWDCFGSDARYLDCDDNHASTSVIFDSVDQTVYQVTVYDYERNRAYRMINPDYKLGHADEAAGRDVESDQAWDEVKYIDLETDEDFMAKARAIISGQDYDTRVQVPVDFSDEELLTYMKLAHERDITFNQLVEEALREAIADFNKNGGVNKTV